MESKEFHGRTKNVPVPGAPARVSEAALTPDFKTSDPSRHGV